MSPSLVSVIIPVYNEAKYLGEALDSVFAQDYRPLEVIVVDDGSTDDSATIAQSYPEVVYLRQENQGPAAARNLGITHCTGKLVAFLDADDLWTPNKLALQTNYLKANPEVACVIGRMKNFLQQGMEKPAWVADSMLSEDLVAFNFGALLVYRWAFDSVGMLNAKYFIHDVLDWFMRFNDLRLVSHSMQEVMQLRRLHMDNISQAIERNNRERIRALKDAMGRKLMRDSIHFAG
ncbi:MAG: glycosyltransferase family A protein [Formivibrio sp.]|nr:glycosyltransferase family A protein [Formivibrio sp.]